MSTLDTLQIPSPESSPQLTQIIDTFLVHPKKPEIERLATVAIAIKSLVAQFDYMQSSAEVALDEGRGNCITLAQITGVVGRAIGYKTYRHIEVYSGNPHNSSVFLNKDSGEIYELDYSLHGALSPQQLRGGTQYSSRSLSRLAGSKPQKPFVGVDSNPHAKVLYSPDELASSFSKVGLRKDAIIEDRLANSAIHSVFDSGIVLPRGSDLESRLFIGSICATAATLCMSVVNKDVALS